MFVAYSFIMITIDKWFQLQLEIWSEGCRVTRSHGSTMRPELQRTQLTDDAGSIACNELVNSAVGAVTVAGAGTGVHS
jgi:hypothetical protein